MQTMDVNKVLWWVMFAKELFNYTERKWRLNYEIDIHIYIVYSSTVI